ncbi:DUF5937 family protein [Streptomyces syringium]|uniref:DUF5937 family protein n=1 Tax=Streptomyces syringium TaxID=76729 RepID=UPI0034540362
MHRARAGSGRGRSPAGCWRIRRLLEDCEQAFCGETWRCVRVRSAADARHTAELLKQRSEDVAHPVEA